MKKNNLFFYNGKLRTPGAIWRGIWNIEGTGISKVNFLWHRVRCAFGIHEWHEVYSGECNMPGPNCCAYCDKVY